MTGKFARQTVRESYPRAVCRHGWTTPNGVRVDYYEILPSLRVSGYHLGTRYIHPVVLGTGDSKPSAWIAAAEKLIASVEAAA